MNIINRLRSSFKAKLIASFLVAAGVPYIITFLTLLGGNEQKILENISKELVAQTRLFSEELKKNLYNTEHDIRFLSKYDVMDDMLTGDIDKRISKLLEAKKTDMGIDGELFCLDMTGKIVASSNQSLIGKEAPLALLKGDFLDLHDSPFFSKKMFTLSIPLFATFDNTKQTGSMVLEFSAENFKNYLYSDSTKKLFLYNPKNGEFLGDTGGIKPVFTHKSGVVELNGYLLGYQKLENTEMHEWYFVSATAKEEATKFLQEFRFSFAISVAIGLVLIVAVSLFFAGKVIRPIRELFDATNEVIDTADYSERVKVSSKDEIGQLSKSFNEMISMVQLSMDSLERENEERLRLFVTLIGIFNKILIAKSEDETFDIAKNELQNFLPDDQVGFVFDAAVKEQNDGKAEFFEITIPEEESSAAPLRYYISITQTGEISNIQREFFTSIAKMISLQLERLKLFEKTDAASRAKSAFIANMSHELRTPLNSIIGFSQFLQSVGVLPEAYRDAPKNIEISGKHLLSMINEILDFAKIEAGKMSVNIEAVEVDMVLSEVAAITQSLAVQKGLSFEVQRDSGIKAQADYGALKQILINLVSNAIKFTEKGGIQISATISGGLCEIVVKDSGIGVSEEDAKKLFSDFTQIENPMQKKHKGTGLGLSLSKKMAALMGGELMLSSEGVGCGSTAKIILGHL